MLIVLLSEPMGYKRRGAGAVRVGGASLQHRLAGADHPPRLALGLATPTLRHILAD